MENYSTDKFDKLCDVFFAFIYIYIYIPFPSFTGNMPHKRVKLQFVWLGLRFRDAKPVQSQLQKILT